MSARIADMLRGPGDYRGFVGYCDCKPGEPWTDAVAYAAHLKAEHARRQLSGRPADPYRTPGDPRVKLREALKVRLGYVQNGDIGGWDIVSLDEIPVEVVSQ